jgi:3-deoxy-D-manno-octulosonic-acid transferase
MRGKEMRGRLAERRGVDPTPRPPGRLIWLHAASLGETTAILPLLPKLAEHVQTTVLTTGTVTSARLLAQRLEPDLAGRVLHRFVPLDVPAWVARFLDHWRPDAAALVESELWPNLLAACRMRHVPVMLINARLSDRSFARWRRVPTLALDMLESFARVHPRGPTDADRLRALGCCRLEPPGDLKLAAPPLPVDQAELQRLTQMLAGRPIWLAASTHPGEEALVLAAHRELANRHGGLLTIIAPRHPERGAAIPGAGHRSRVVGPPREGVWVADTLGELGLWYRLTGLAFIGRSLLPPGGGQNPLEAARLGCAIAVGPLTGNFTDHVALLRAVGGLTVVRDATELAGWADALLSDPARRQAAGEAAAAAVCRHGDLPERITAMLLDLIR